MKLRKVFHKAPASPARIPRLLTLCAFFAAGTSIGNDLRRQANRKESNL